MYKLLGLLAVIGCALSASLPKGLVRQSSGRNFDGISTTINRYPYTASVQRNGAHSCSGVVYSYNLIVTAAHCMQDINLQVLRIRVGSTFWNSGGTFCNVDRVLNHENYNPNTMENDIALVRLINYIAYDSNVRNIKFATNPPPANVNGVVSGWGNHSQRQLLYAEVTTISKSLCSSKAYGYGSQIKDNMLCAKGAGVGSCQGDSGGPLVVDGLLAGIVTWGYDCGSGNYPGVYTNVAYYRDWVRQSIDNNLRPRVNYYIRTVTG